MWEALFVFAVGMVSGACVFWGVRTCVCLMASQREEDKMKRTGNRPEGEKKMQELKQRLVEEKKELCDKLAKLRQFLTTAEYAEMEKDQRYLLKQQEDYMQSYADILGERIARFN